MKIYKILFVVWGVALFAFNANALTCATDDTVYYIHYSCGDGTLADGQTLPEPTPVKYNQTVTPQLIKSQCVGPYDGSYKWAGYQIVAEPRVVDEWGDGEQIVADVLSKTAQSFVYKYTRDITIQPRWVDTMSEDIVPGGIEYTATNGVLGEWSFVGWSGTASGVSYCGAPMVSNVGANLGITFGLTSGDSIADYMDTGPVCYCLNRQCSGCGPVWVQTQVYDDVDACSAECATTCGKSMMDAQTGMPIRRSMVSGCGRPC